MVYGRNKPGFLILLKKSFCSRWNQLNLLICFSEAPESQKTHSLWFFWEPRFDCECLDIWLFSDNSRARLCALPESGIQMQSPFQTPGYAQGEHQAHLRKDSCDLSGSPGFNPSSLGTVPKGSPPLLGSIHNENRDLGSSRCYSQHLGASLPSQRKPA